MDANLSFVWEKRLERVAEALRGKGVEVLLAETAAEVAPLVQAMLPAGCTVAAGGSMTLGECGVMDLLRSGAYEFLDRDAPGVDRDAMMHAAFGADWYLSSANAVTEAGEIYEVDGNGNRVAALSYGPKNLLLVVGRNKLAADLAAAYQRRWYVAGPANSRRVGAKAPCVQTGVCADCQGPGRICNKELVIRRQTPGRMRLILVNEDLGY